MVGNQSALKHTTPDGSWRDFIESHWERSHAYLPNAAATLPLPKIEPDELFSAVVECVNDYIRGSGQIIRLYLDNIEINVLRDKQQHLLPQSSDKSFEAYHERIVQQTGTSDYSLIVTDWHQFDRSIWERIVATVADISSQVGISASRIDTQLFLGTYKRTPFGVHVDDTSAFHFPVIGNKTMRFWADEFASQNPRLHHARCYEEYLDASTEVNAQPGDVIYWPSDYWHVGEGDGKLSVTWRFAYWVADGFRQFAARRAAEYLDTRSKAGHSAFSASTGGGDVQINDIDTIIGDLNDVVTSGDYRDELTRVMLEQISAFGFLRLPAVLEPPKFFVRSIRRKEPFKFFSAPLSQQRLCVAAAGCSIELDHDPSIEKLMMSLNSGTSFMWLDLLKQGFHADSVKKVLQLGFISGALCD